MELIETYRGFEICRVSAGLLVVLDPEDTPQERFRMVSLLAAEGAFDALFFAEVTEAREAIDGYIALGLTRE